MSIATEPSHVTFEGEKGRLAEVAAPVFSLILQLRGAHELGAAETLRQRVKALLEKTRREALRAGVAPEDTRAAEFALVAFLDETLLSSEWSERDAWVARPLQLELYERFDAGEEFFDRLDGLRANPGLHAEVIEVFYLCMALGFKGRYQLHGQEELHRLIEETQAELARQPGMQPGPLAPHGRPRDPVAAEVRSRLPAWAVLAVVALIGLLLYAGASVFISRSADTAARDIERMAEPELLEAPRP